MSPSWSQRSAIISARRAPSGTQRRNGRPAESPERSASEYNGRPRAVPDPSSESIDDWDWDERVAREVRHQQVIEASFDRAEAYERLGDFEPALEWLDRAAGISGGLPATYRARRARLARSAAVRPRPAGGGWNTNLEPGPPN